MKAAKCGGEICKTFWKVGGKDIQIVGVTVVKQVPDYHDSGVFSGVHLGGDARKIVVAR